MYHRKNRNFPAPFIITAFLGLFVSNLTIAQVKAPQITPLSPNAAALWKYAELPVNMYTGIPSISIPIYEIKSGSLTVPISLSYHAGGLRYEEQASWVGLGWTLNHGGAINRNVKGVADERGVLHPDNQFTTNVATCDYEYFHNVLNKTIDVESDEFSFNIPGRSGRFVFDPVTKQQIMIPYDPIKFTYTHVPNGNLGSLTNLQLVDESGTTYKFGTTETTTGGAGIYTEENYPSTWLLTEMKSVDETKTISFNYAPGDSWVQKLSSTQSISVIDQSTGSPQYDLYLQLVCSGPPSPQISYPTTTSLNYLTDTKYISEILFENGKIQFVQSASYRTDLYNQQRSLEYVRIFSKEGTTYKLIKSVKFFYSYFQRMDTPAQSADWKLKLDKVEMLDALGNTIDKYNLEYNTNYFTTENAEFARDYWGGYNGAITNTNLIPQQEITYYGIANSVSNTQQPIGGAANREPNENYLTQGVLKKIVYPTGGYTQFEYEINKYQYETSAGIQSGNAGGLRVKKITSAGSVTETPLVKTFKYGVNENGYGFKNFLSAPGFFVNTTIVIDHANGGPCSEKFHRLRTYNSQSSLQIDGFDGSPVLYPFVKVYDGDATNNNGWTEFVYDNGNPDQDNVQLISSFSQNSFYRQSHHWRRGHLTSKRVLDKYGQKVSETLNSYQELNQVLKTAGLLLTEEVSYPNNIPGTPCYTTLSGLHRYGFNLYSVLAGVNKLSSATETVYDPNDPSRSTTNGTTFTYDVNYLQPLEVNKTLRKLQTGYEEQVIDYTKYPFSYSFTGTPSGSDALGIKLLQDKNISAVPIEQYTVKKFKNPTTWQSDITAGTITTFRSDKPYPDKIWQIETTAPVTSASFGSGSTIVSNAFSKHSTYKEKLAFTSYDAAGNILQYNKVNDVTNTYLWDYLNVYPVAEIVNAANANIAFTSFEAENKGNWTFTGSPAADATAPTGKKAYTPNGSNNITKSGLSTGTTYIVSYWIKTTSPLTITGTIGSAIAGRTLGLWKYYEHRITGQTSVNITGTVPIDELRLYPVGALMTSYTHEPLLGLLSQCDAQNRITYYEYDNIGRLQLIRDQDRNIIKTFEYKYKTNP